VFSSRSPSMLSSKDGLLSSTHDTQTCLKNIESHHPGWGKEKGDKGASCSIGNIISCSLQSPIALPTPESSLSSCPPSLLSFKLALSARRSRALNYTLDSHGMNIRRRTKRETQNLVWERSDIARGSPNNEDQEMRQNWC
jgi:hypothetical protein